ncbi:CinA family protein [Reinekea blandensis]|uniref:CinA-related protein n=1 Tax=Reinekea blandensis MED297 TaxID=314283 RepID=A4BCI9_9GAMM|nr:CinA family protein [Reinekea blandensis]EAR10255.1 cinA-related protein [Reinekea sp. MED297] [Reinekea blandensis MED297]
MELEKLAARLMAKQQTMSTVESCTGGGIAAYCTDLPGSSQWFTGGVVTYSNAMKVQLGVHSDDIVRCGAVSETVVQQMAAHGRRYCQSDWCVAVSGVAGPDGGSPEKPVGTVWFAWSGPDGFNRTDCHHFTGSRSEVRRQTVETALEVLHSLISSGDELS